MNLGTNGPRFGGVTGLFRASTNPPFIYREYCGHNNINYAE